MRWTSVFILFMILGCDRQEQVPVAEGHARGEPHTVRDVLGDARLAITNAPAEITVFRLDPPKLVSGVPRIPYGSWPTIGDPVHLDAEMASRLSKILTDNATFVWTLHASCVYEPGVKVRFIKGNDKVEMFLCFECQTLIVDNRDARETDIVFDTRKVAPLLKEIFPKDPVIQGLKLQAPPTDN